MGIQGLTSYVETRPYGRGKVWEPYNLQDTNLIIDGCGLYYYIYSSNHMNIKYGGQYKQLENKVKAFFAKLRAHNVVSYVILDGTMDRDEKKFATILKRKRKIIKQMAKLWTSRNHSYDMVIPRLAQMVFIQVLQEIKVPYVVADFEADCEIAVLANELDAPVMANDSDFFIFNIQRGYIPFQNYDLSGPNTNVRKFNFDGFTKHLGMAPEMSPLLASLVGNDYMSSMMLSPFTAHIQKLVSSSQLVGFKKCVVPSIAQFLSRYQSMPQAIKDVLALFPKCKKPAFEKALYLSIEEYQSTQSNLIEYFGNTHLDSNVQTYNGHHLPEWIVKLHREGAFAEESLMCLCHRKTLLRTQSEDVSLPSAQDCVHGLRWYYHALVMHCECSVVAETFEQNCVEVEAEITKQEEANVQYKFVQGRPVGIEAQKQLQACSQDFGQTSEARVESELLANMEGFEQNSKVESEVQRQVLAGVDSYYVQNEVVALEMTINHCDIPSTSQSKLATDPNNVISQKEDLRASIQQLKVDETGSGQTPKEEVALPLHTNKVLSESSTASEIEKEIIVIELDREGLSLGNKKVNLTLEVCEREINIHDIPEMLDGAKKSHLLNLLESNLPFIHKVSIKHQLIVAALRYWIKHTEVKQEHLAALLVHYIGERQRQSDKTRIQASATVIHGFAQWQNVVYWVERLNTLFFSTFPQLQVAQLYDGVHVCVLYERFKTVGISLAGSIVSNVNLYRQMYDAITTDLPRDCQFNQSRHSNRKIRRSKKLEQVKEEKSTSSKEYLKGNKFAVLCDDE